MDPELVLAIVAAALFAAVVWLGALAQGLDASAHEPEPRAWWVLMRPLYVWAVTFAFLWGWSLQEPNPADERAGLRSDLLATLGAVIALRALVRAIRALRSASIHRAPIATVGLLRPRIVVSRSFLESVPEEVIRAALAHERAHVERRDPLRIWLAQIGADLQWPVPGASQRFAAWLLALEADRDSSALADGTDPTDLAEAIVTAARLQCCPVPTASARAAGAGDGIAWRVHRLLSPDAATVVARPQSRLVRAWWLALLLGALCLGLVYGESVMHALLGAAR